MYPPAPTPLAGCARKILMDSSQYFARTDPTDVRRLGSLRTVDWSLGSVSDFQPLEIEPPSPLVDIASATTTTTGTSATPTRMTAPARRRVGCEGAWRAA